MLVIKRKPESNEKYNIHFLFSKLSFENSIRLVFSFFAFTSIYIFPVIATSIVFIAPSASLYPNLFLLFTDLYKTSPKHLLSFIPGNLLPSNQTPSAFHNMPDLNAQHYKYLHFIKFSISIPGHPQSSTTLVPENFFLQPNLFI